MSSLSYMGAPRLCATLRAMSSPPVQNSRPMVMTLYFMVFPPFLMLCPFRPQPGRCTSPTSVQPLGSMA